MASWLLLEQCKIPCKVRTNGADSSVYEGLEKYMSATNISDINFRKISVIVYGHGRLRQVLTCVFMSGRTWNMGWGALSGRQRRILFWEGSDLFFLHCPLPSSRSYFLLNNISSLLNIIIGQHAQQGRDMAVSRYGSFHGAKSLQIFSLFTISMVAAPPRAKGQVIHPRLLLYFK